MIFSFIYYEAIQMKRAPNLDLRNWSKEQHFDLPVLQTSINQSFSLQALPSIKTYDKEKAKQNQFTVIQNPKVLSSATTDGKAILFGAGWGILRWNQNQRPLSEAHNRTRQRRIHL